MAVDSVVQVLDNDLKLITEVKSFVPFDESSNYNNIINYSNSLSTYGSCKFRIHPHDTIFDDYGDIFVPHKNHIRIKKGDKIVWQGAIISNPTRSTSYIEVNAYTYEFYLGKKLIHRTSPDASGNKNIYRIFKSGTMASAITSIINETITDYKNSTSVLSKLTIGTIENPDYPSNLTSDYDSSSLTGSWYFGESTADAKGPELDYEFNTVLYVLKAFGIYTYADFEITEDLVFNFKKFLGTKQQDKITFTYGEQGDIIDYNVPRDGKGQVNSVIGTATDSNGVILNSEKTDDSSIKEYGLLEAAAGYSGILGQGILDARISAELPMVTAPDESNFTIYLNENSYPLGQYGLGDLITVKIKDTGIDINKVMRIVAINVLKNETGREVTALVLNTPYSWQI